ncbi:transposase [Streptomyces alfalfae]
MVKAGDRAASCGVRRIQRTRCGSTGRPAWPARSGLSSRTGPRTRTQPPERERSRSPAGEPATRRRAPPPARSPTLIVDGQGIPLAVSLASGNRNGITQLLPRSTRSRTSQAESADPADAPTHSWLDGTYDPDKYRRLLRQRGIRPVIAQRGEPHGIGLGTFRYVVEGTVARLHGFRRLRIRWERRDDIREAFLELAVRVITYRHIQRLSQCI